MSQSYSFYQSQNYQRTRPTFPIYKTQIQEAERAVLENPHIGKPFKGGLRYYRHIVIGNGIRLIYVICQEARRLSMAAWSQSLARKNATFHACEKFCNQQCVIIPENGIVFLAVMDHTEQNNFFG